MSKAGIAMISETRRRPCLTKIKKPATNHRTRPQGGIARGTRRAARARCQSKTTHPATAPPAPYQVPTAVCTVVVNFCSAWHEQDSLLLLSRLSKDKHLDKGDNSEQRGSRVRRHARPSAPGSTAGFAVGLAHAGVLHFRVLPVDVVDRLATPESSRRRTDASPPAASPAWIPTATVGGEFERLGIHLHRF